MGVGDLVEPDTVVALSRGKQRRAVNVAQALGVAPNEISQYLLKAEGDGLALGEAIARRRQGRWRTRQCLSPCEGFVLAVTPGSGWVVCEEPAESAGLLALVRGTVAQVLPARGVVIETKGALVQGIWCCGREAVGTVRMAVSDPAEDLTAGAVDVDCRGCILVGGSGASAAALRQAAEAGVAGVVLGGVAARSELISDRLQGLAVLVTEGFGHVPMSRSTFDLLSSCVGHQAMISGAAADPGLPGFPEVVIPLPLASGLEQPLSRPPLGTGVQVRLTSPLHLGLVGRIVDMPACGVVVSPGVWLPGALVDVQGRHLPVPLTNLEALLT
jgi:hypothetical protein